MHGQELWELYLFILIMVIQFIICNSSMTKTRELIRRDKLLFGEVITMELEVGPLKDQEVVEVAVLDSSVAGLQMLMLVR